jgi:hypothetical protein
MKTARLTPAQRAESQVAEAGFGLPHRLLMNSIAVGTSSPLSTLIAGVSYARRALHVIEANALPGLLRHFHRPCLRRLILGYVLLTRAASHPRASQLTSGSTLLLSAVSSVSAVGPGLANTCFPLYARTVRSGSMP